MRNGIIGILLLLAFLLPGITIAQCPVSGFSTPDSVCGNIPFQITNTGTPGNSFTWDLCPGDLNLIPTGVNLGNIGTLGAPQQMRMIKDNGKYFLLIADQGLNALRRYDYGNSLDNVPVLFDYGNVSSLLSQPSGMDVVQENGVWYAIIVNFANQKLIRVDLGASIEANIASAVDLGAFGLVSAYNLKVVKDGANYYAFATSSQFTRVDFGNSITNIPSGSTAIPVPTSNLGWGFDMSYDCNQNKFIGFYSDYLQSKIFILDFGNTLSNTPVVSGNVNTGSGPSGLCLLREGTDFHIIVTIANVSYLQNFKIGSDLLATPVSIYLDPVGGINNPQSVLAYGDSSRVYSFVSNAFPTSVSQISWPNNCQFSPSFSNDPTSITTTSTAGGFQTITLAAIDAQGLTNVYADSIYIRPVPVSNFYASDGCEGLPVQFNDLSTISLDSITSWSWDFGDSSPIVLQQNPSHLFPGTGPYTVSLTTQSSPLCPGSTYSSTVTINPIPDAAFTYVNNACQFSIVNFTDLSQAFGSTFITNWLWDFGDTTTTDTTQNPLHTFQSSGTFTVKLIVTTNTGCTDSISQTITILPSPVALFDASSTCIGETVVFNNTSSIAGGGAITYNWDFGDNSTSIASSPTYQYALVSGNYDVQLIAQASNGCVDTLVQTIHIANTPTPQFSWTPLIVCVGNLVTFTNTSTGNGGDTIALNLWDFGDGDLSTDLNPMHAYADTGIFQVTLTVFSPTDCDSSLTQQITVIPAPTASFSASQVCLNFPTIFNPSVTTPPGTVVDSVVWTYGDGNGFTGTTSPTHIYSAPGRYEVIMTVYNNLLCTGSFIDSVDVFSLPTAAFTTSLVCSSSPTIFDGTSSQILNDSLTAWTWDFAGLGTSTDSIAQFSFQNAGTYNVTLIVYSSHGCSDTLLQPIEVVASPDFDFVFNEPCFGDTSNFTFIQNVTPAPGADLIWDFGDGIVSILLNPSHLYSTIDTFYVSLSVTEDSSGCTATKIKPLVIHPLPIVGFVANSICEELPVTLNNTSSISSGTITTWNWNLGVFGTSNVADPVVTPSDSGNYTLSLTVISDQGCSATANGNLTVYEKPHAAIVPDPLYGSPPVVVNFANNTIGGSTYFWDFGDGNNDNGFSPSHLYADTGNYSVSMIATSIYGCLDTATAQVSVLIPYLDLEVNQIFYTKVQDQFQISARLINKGYITINSFQLRQQLENNSVIAEQWQGILLPGSQLIYQFQSTYLVNSASEQSYYCVEALNPNDSEDDYPSNNSKCNSIVSNFEIFSVYPNPFNENLTVNFNLNTDGPVDLEIYDLAGKLVLRSKANKQFKGYNSISIPVVQLSKGVYTVLLRFRDEEDRSIVVKAQ